MKLTKDHIEWVKSNRIIILDLLNKRKEDYIRELILEEDEIKSKVMKMWIKELEAIIITINNLCNKQEKKKQEGENFTGI